MPEVNPSLPPVGVGASAGERQLTSVRSKSFEYPRHSFDIGNVLDRLLLARYSPPAVLINERMDIYKFRGDTSPYLRNGPGEHHNNVIIMASSGLAVAIRTSVARAKKEMAPVRMKAVEADQRKSSKVCDLIVVPFSGIPNSKEDLFVVLFEPAASSKAKGSTRKHSKTMNKPITQVERRQVVKLEHELATTQEYLKSLFDDQDYTNGNLNSANEELVSNNEELQSLNEEMTTAKAQLQSTNEKLVAVNDELRNRNQVAVEANNDLANVLSTVDVPILILDVERRIRRFNPTARIILNILSSDIGRPFEDIRSNILGDDLGETITRVIAMNTLHQSEVQDRSGHWYRMQIRPYTKADGKIDGVTILLIDIDSLKHHINEAQQAKTEAERANRAKDEFLATLSHEIRTPLSSMLMQAQLLGRGILDEAKVKRAAEVIERGTRAQVKMIDDLLDVSRIVAGKLQIEAKPVDLSIVIRSALESVTAPAERKGLHFLIALDENVGIVCGDPVRLQQIVVNLLSNAIKFSADNGRISVALSSVDGGARIEIGDTGSGIEPAFLPHIFNRFAQEDGTTIRRHGGLGLGLAIVRHLAEAHGGTVHAASAGRGKGATFSVILPVVNAVKTAIDETPVPALHDPTPTSRSIVRLPLQDMRILVVDDDLACRDTVAEMLGGTGAQVRVAGSACEGMAAVEDFRPEILVCDISMPGEDGYSFIQSVRVLDAARGGGGIPALALTAFAGEENYQRALAAGFQMHLAKPVDIDVLARAVADLLTQQSV